MRTHHFHAWRRMRDLGDDWTLAWSDDLPEDVFGFTDFGAQTITLAKGLSFEERRCTITHEIEHVLRGPTSTHSVLREELVVDWRAARRLLPSMRDIADSLVWHHGGYEAVSEDLWVDPWTLEVRLAGLGPREREYLDRRLAEVVLLQGGC